MGSPAVSWNIVEGESGAPVVAGRVREIYDRDAEDRQKEAGKFHGRGKEKVVPTRSLASFAVTWAPKPGGS